MNFEEAYNAAKRNKKACVNAPDHPVIRNGVSYPALITNATMEKDRTGIVVEFCIWMNSEGTKKECRFSLKGYAENYFTSFCDDLGVENYKALPGIPLWISFEMNDVYQNVRVYDASITIEELKEEIKALEERNTSGRKKRTSSLDFAEKFEQEDFDEDFGSDNLQKHMDTVKQRKKRSSTAIKSLKRRRAVQRKQEDFEEESEPEDSDDFEEESEQEDSEEEFESDDFDTEEDFEPENLQKNINTVKQRKKSKRRSGTATKGLKRRRAVQRKQEDFEEDFEPEESDDFEEEIEEPEDSGEEFESDDFDTEED